MAFVVVVHGCSAPALRAVLLGAGEVAEGSTAHGELTATAKDQSELVAMIDRLHAVGMVILEVRRVEAQPPDAASPTPLGR